MNQLTTTESQRVLAVLTEMLEKLTFLSFMPGHYDPVLQDSLENSGCSDVAEGLDDVFQLEESMQVIQSGHGGIDSTRINTPAAADLRNKLAVATRSFCRGVRDDPTAADHLRAACSRRTEIMLSCITWLTELRAVMQRKLLTTVEDVNSKMQQLDEFSAREKEADDDRKTLMTQLSMERREKNRDVTQLDAVLSKLKLELQDIKMSTSEEESLLEKETTETMKAAEGSHDETMTALTASIAKLSEELAKAKEDSEVNEQAVRKKKAKAELEVQGWVTRFDKEMGAKQAEIDELRALFDDEQRRLQELEEHFEKVDAERELIAVEEKEFAEEKAKILEEDAVEDVAATGLQKLWRGWLGRQAVAALKKGGGKKGKKKKK